MRSIFNGNGLIVSCQAYPGDPMYGQRTMVQMAIAAQMGGAVGIRANGTEDIRNIKFQVDIPVVGLIKRAVAGSDIYITPDWSDAELIVNAGADVVAIDVTSREQRIEKAMEIIEKVHRAGAYVMADISTLEEGLIAEQIGADLISTTLSGYTTYSPQREEPDLELVARLSKQVNVPVVAEGRIHTPQLAKEALKAGARWVVVGGGITRPELITRRFADEISELCS